MARVTLRSWFGQVPESDDEIHRVTHFRPVERPNRKPDSYSFHLLIDASFKPKARPGRPLPGDGPFSGAFSESSPLPRERESILSRLTVPGHERGNRHGQLTGTVKETGKIHIVRICRLDFPTRTGWKGHLRQNQITSLTGNIGFAREGRQIRLLGTSSCVFPLSLPAGQINLRSGFLTSTNNNERAISDKASLAKTTANEPNPNDKQREAL